MKSLLVIALFQVAACSLFSDEWHSFKAEHMKKYTSPREEQFRFGVYQKNKQMIEEHNKKFEAGLVAYELRMNRFGDKLPEEVAFELTGFNRSGLAGVKRPASLTFNGYSRRVPASVDWRKEGAVTPVKDQGSCGACWAFSATGSLEGQLFRKTGKLVSLSEQNLLDCAGEEYGNQGCNGGLMDNAFQYVLNNGGIDSERSYPYEAQENECRFRNSAVVGTISQYVDIPRGDEDALKEAVATVGPISVAINAMKPLMFYHRGIFSNEECDGEVGSLNHGVLLVGYGSDNGQDYWLIKNSWNSHWGEEGYVRIARNTNNMCGVATFASYPIV